jgi:hypothetical protein
MRSYPHIGDVVVESLDDENHYLEVEDGHKQNVFSREDA